MVDAHGWPAANRTLTVRTHKFAKAPKLWRGSGRLRRSRYLSRVRRETKRVNRGEAFVVQRARIFAICLGLTVVVFSQASGSEAADTKLDLLVSPYRFLQRSLQLWDPTANAGQVQDQAYGYLFPMGPFFVVGHLVRLEPWVIQRSWESLLVVAAFLGVLRLARELGVPGFYPRVGAALVYTLCPRMLAELMTISSELLPMVALPWTLIPLVQGAREGSPRRAAARSGIALLFAGGINASATLAILPVPALWLLTRARGSRRRALMGWWTLSVLLSTMWWAVPLTLVGRYSPRFLDWIESSRGTTRSTSLLATLRGVDHWQAYLGPSEWPGAWVLVRAAPAIVATTIVVALCVWGLAQRSAPHLLFLGSCLVLGLAFVTLGHVSTVGPPFATELRALLDGPLNAFRNVHKGDPILRLPLAIGAGHALGALGTRVPRRLKMGRVTGGLVVYPRAVLVTTLLAVGLVAVSPALTNRLAARTRVVNEPTWWTQTAQWLKAHEAAQGRALVVPGAGQPVYVWGSSREDALQPVAESPWSSRDQVPFAQPGYIRLLDSIEARIATAQPDPVLPEVLARAGIRYLIVRNDLDTSASNATPLRFVHATVDNTPGLSKVAQFGPDLSSADPNRLVDLGLVRPGGSVEIYANSAWTGQVSILQQSDVVLANGAADKLPDLVSAGLSDSRPVIFENGAGDSGISEQSQSVLTDGIRRRSASFSRVSSYSATMTATDPFPDVRAAHDYLGPRDQVLSTVKYVGIDGLAASSSGSDANAYVNRSPAHNAYAAVDGDPGTSWYSGAFGGASGQWFEIAFSAPNSADGAYLTLAPTLGKYPSTILVSTDRGSQLDTVEPNGGRQWISLPKGATSTLRLTVSETRDDPGNPWGFGIADLTVPGVRATRTLAVSGPQQPDVIAFTAASGYRSQCATADGAAVCDPSWAAAGEEDDALDRSFSLKRANDFRTVATYRLLPGLATNALLDAGNPIGATASSEDSTDPRERAGAAVDGLPSTGWVPASTDRTPSIKLSFPPAELTGVHISSILGGATSSPVQVRVQAAGLDVESVVPPSGVIRFPAARRLSSLQVTVLSSSLRVSTDSVTLQARLLPVGIGEIALVGKQPPRARVPSSISVACVLGPALEVNGTRIQLGLTDVASAQVLAGQPVVAQPCADASVRLPAGPVRVRLESTGWARPVSLRLADPSAYLGAAASAPPAVQVVGDWGDTRRHILVPSVAETRILVVRENYSDGWLASLGGHPLAGVMVDGWEQGYLIPAGSSGVLSLSFTPQRLFSYALGLGIGAWLLLVVGAILPSRRRTRAPALAEASLTRRFAMFAMLLAGALLGGVAGLLIGVAAIAISKRVPPWGGPGCLVVAGVLDAAHPAGSLHPFSLTSGCQALGLLSLELMLSRRLPAGPTSGEAPQEGPLDPVPTSCSNQG